jgi:hypothetical protein
MSPLLSLPFGATFTRSFVGVHLATGPLAFTQRSCTKTSRLPLVSTPGARRSDAVLANAT